MRGYIGLGVWVLVGASACTVSTASPIAAPRCEEGRLIDGPFVVDCAARGHRCDALAGCVGCSPGAMRCDGESPSRCAADGETWEPGASCVGTESCSGGRCVDACMLAERESSYLGCSYDAVSTPNSLLAEGFHFGLVVGNTSDAPADVVVTRGDVEVATLTVAPHSAAHAALPFVTEISRVMDGSTLVPDGAYHVTSTRPIAAYQYNPLEFRNAPSCVYTGTREDSACFSFTNDASLLLPTHALGTDYLVTTVTHPGALPSTFVTIVARTAAHVSLLPRADVTASADGAVSAHVADERFETDLDAGDVLTLVSLAGSLDASEIQSDAPLLVVAGCDCADVPAAFGACDHIEEVMLPVSTWGTTAIAAAPRSVDDEPSLLRVMSAVDGNAITITGLASTITLDRGEAFEVVLSRDVVVDGTGPLVAMQYLVGAQYFDRGQGGALGDPAMGVAPFEAQFRTSYGFAAPDTYTRHFAAIVTNDARGVRLDGQEVLDWSPIEGSAFQVARVAILSGAHTLDAPHGAGLTLYGLAPYTSYLLPGGLDVEPLR